MENGIAAMLLYRIVYHSRDIPYALLLTVVGTGDCMAEVSPSDQDRFSSR